MTKANTHKTIKRHAMMKHEDKEHGKTPKHEAPHQHKPQSHTEQEQHRDHRLRTASSTNHRGGGGDA